MATDPGSFNPGGAMPGTTANTSGDSSTLSSTYQMTRADLATKVTYNGTTTTIGQLVQMWEKLPANQIINWEQSLVEAGLQRPSSTGDPQARADAFNSLLRFAAFNGEDVLSTLTRLKAESGGGTAAKSAAGLKVHAQLSNPLDVKYLGDTVAQKLIGRDLTPQEAQDITNMIRGQEVGSANAELSAEQSAAAANTGTGTGQGGVITTAQPTSPEAATEQYLTQHQGPDVQSHALLNVFEAIKSKVETDAQGSGPKAASGPIKVM